MKTYGQKRFGDRMKRNPFDELLPRQSTAQLPSSQAPRFEETETNKTDVAGRFSVYVDTQREDNADDASSNRKNEGRLPRNNPRIDTPMATSAAYYPRVSRKPFRSPRISRIVTQKVSSEDEIESEDTQTDDSWTSCGAKSSSWTTVNKDTGISNAPTCAEKKKKKTLDASGNESLEISNIEIPRKASTQSKCIPEVELLVKSSSPALDVSSSIESENSLTPMETKGKRQLNSTLLDEDFAKNLDELKNAVNISPILPEKSEENVHNRHHAEQRTDDEEHKENVDINMADPMEKQINQETTPVQKGNPFKLLAPLKPLRWSLPDKINKTKESGTKSAEAPSRKKLSPMYNKVPAEERRIRKKTSTPVRNAFQFESPPIFSTDLSSVRDDSVSGLHFYQSVEVNSEEIHVTLDTSPASNLDTEFSVQSLVQPENVCSQFPHTTATTNQGNGKNVTKRTGVVDKGKRISGRVTKIKNTRKGKKSEGQTKCQEKYSVFSFVGDSSDDEPPQRTKFRKIRSESPSREDLKRKEKTKPGQLIQSDSKLTDSAKKKSPNVSSPPSSKKTVTWGSTTCYEYSRSSPILMDDEGATVSSNKFPICLIIALDHCWTSGTDGTDKLPPLNPSETPRRAHYDLDILCKDW